MYITAAQNLTKSRSALRNSLAVGPPCPQQVDKKVTVYLENHLVPHLTLAY